MGLLARMLAPLRAMLIALARRPLRAWVRARITPTDVRELGLDGARPLCYVLRNDSLTDWLALEAVCADHGLPRPWPAQGRELKADRALALGLHAHDGGDLQRVLAHATGDAGVQLVPVSIFWGRNPIKETSLLRILLADVERPGRLRKLFIILAQGRRSLVHFGQPLDLRTFADDGQSPAAAQRKLARVLRVHFRRQRTATLGPPLSHRSQVIAAVLAQPAVRAAIERAAHGEGGSYVEARAQARSYADEIAADYSNIAIGFMLRVLDWLWTRVYDGVDVRHLQRLRAASHDAALVYLPAHRSHMDYLLVSYILYKEGLALPQVAAGINLNFWPVGGLLRRCGAFYLRRSFGGDKLYTAVFRAYIDVLIGRGRPLKFYLEGGRSRTGRLLAPKTGLLAMAVDSAQTQRERPVALVPVFIGYDRVMEVNSYFEELRGARVKKGESIAALLRGARKLLSRQYGRAYIAFGEPLRLDEIFAADPPPADDDARGAWLSRSTDAVAAETMRRINAAATLNAAGLAALVLLGTPQKAVAEDEMRATLALLARLAARSPYSPDTTVPAADGAALLAEAEPALRLERIPHAWGDVLSLEPRQAVLATYTRNTVMHLFALPSLLANFFVHAEARKREDIVAEAASLYPLLASELSLRFPAGAVAAELESTLTAMAACGLLEATGDNALRRPPVGCAQFAALMSLARITRELIERYAMTLLLLVNNPDGGDIERSKFERGCQRMAERMAIVTGRNSPEFFDARLFRAQVATLTEAGLLHAHGARFGVEPRLAALAEHALQLLGPEIRQSILHLTRSRQALGHDQGMA